jgi:hypothetical protein
MKDKQFLEQLNLYLDGEIDTAGAAELEREILSNPARRRTYNDYCRIHRATKLIYQQFRAAGDAHGADALPPARVKVSEAMAVEPLALGGRTGGRAAPRPFRRLAFASGLAAACAVGVFIGTQALAPRAPEVVQSPAPTLAVSQPAVEAPVVTAEPVKAAQQQSEAAFAAPFAPEVRPDPFVQNSPARSDPFALTPWTIAAEPAGQTPPPSIFTPPVLRVEPRFRPAALDNSAEPQNTARENGPFRLRVNGQTPTNGASVAPASADLSSTP